MMHLSLSLSIYLSISLSLYIYIYIYIHTYTHTYTYQVGLSTNVANFEKDFSNGYLFGEVPRQHGLTIMSCDIHTNTPARTNIIPTSSCTILLW